MAYVLVGYFKNIHLSSLKIYFWESVGRYWQKSNVIIIDFNN